MGVANKLIRATAQAHTFILSLYCHEYTNNLLKIISRIENAIRFLKYCVFVVFLKA